LLSLLRLLCFVGCFVLLVCSVGCFVLSFSLCWLLIPSWSVDLFSWSVAVCSGRLLLSLGWVLASGR
jgi:hypothetical protein